MDVIKWILLIVISAFIAAGSALALTGFQSSLTTGTAGYNITANALSGVQNVSTYFATTGTIVGVVLLLTAVAGIVVAFSFQQR